MKILKKEEWIENNIISASKKRFVGDVEYHGHDFFELEFIVDGKGSYEIDGREYKIQKNSVFLMNPSNVHRINDADAMLINVMFAHEYKDSTLDIYNLLKQSPAFSFDDDVSGFIYELLSELVTVNDDDPDYAMLLLQCVLHKLGKQFPDKKEGNRSYVRQAVLFLQENFYKGVTLEDTSKHLRISPAYLSDLFHRQMGVTFKSYLDEIKFSYSKKLLMYTSLSVKEVCFRSGFSDYANFTRRFKKRYGITPAGCRKEYMLKG